MWKDFLIFKCVVNVLDLFSLLSEPFGEHPCQFIGLEAFPLVFNGFRYGSRENMLKVRAILCILLGKMHLCSLLL